MRYQLLISEWLYTALLHLYPAQFRATYSQQMRMTFRDACRGAYHQGGTGGLLALWLPTLLDLLKSALEEWARQGDLLMPKERLIALSGPLTIVVGTLWLVAALSDLAFQTGLLGDEALLGLVSIPFFVSFIPLLFALLGTRFRFHQSAGILGRLGLALSVAGCAGVVVTMLAYLLWGGMAPEGGEPSWGSFVAASCVHSIRIGYILFGADALRYRLLPRWNLLPLLTGSTILLSLALDWFGWPALLPSAWATPFLHFVISGTCWALLGIALLAPHREPHPVAAI